MANNYGIRFAHGLRPTMLLCLGLSLTGCNDYLDRREGLSPIAGDAVRANIATHVIDPWPRNSQDRTLVLGAERLVEVYERSKEPPPAPPPPRAPTSTR